MNGVRLVLSLLLVVFPATTLPAVRATRHPRAWAHVLTISLGSGFVLVVASLTHATLPLVFATVGLTHLAAACRALGGHLFHGAAWFSLIAGGTTALVLGGAARGVRAAVGVNNGLIRSARLASTTSVGGQQATLLPMSQPWAAAVPGSAPGVVVSPALISSLGHDELDAVIRHEMAHLEHHHARFLFLGVAVTRGLWFLPFIGRSATALRLSLERWADESASRGSMESRSSVSSALRKLATVAPSLSAGDRIRALESTEAMSQRHEWGWPTAISALVPLAMALVVTLVVHLSHVLELAGGG